MNAALAANSSALAPVPEKIAVGGGEVVGEAKSWREKTTENSLREFGSSSLHTTRMK